MVRRKVSANAKASAGATSVSSSTNSSPPYGPVERLPSVEVVCAGVVSELERFDAASSAISLTAIEARATNISLMAHDDRAAE